jgi:hypothetical protein
MGKIAIMQKQRQRTSKNKSLKQSKKACCKCTGQPLPQSSKESFELWEKTATAYLIESGVMGKLQRHWTSRKISTSTALCTASIASILCTKRIKMT